MKTLKKYTAVLMIICIILSIPSPQHTSAAVKSSDIMNQGEICKAVNGLLNATEKSDHMKSIVNYKKGDAYYDIMSIAYNAGYIKPNQNNELSKATIRATYSYVATIFSRIMNVPKKELLGAHKSSSFISKTEFLTFVSQIIPNVITKSLSNKSINGNALINKPNLTLTNITINGNLIIGDGVADQEVILENVTVTGKLIIRGGGENSVKIYGTSSMSEIDIMQVNNKVSVKIADEAEVQIVYINDGCNDVILYGTIGTVNITGDDINVSTNNAAISNVVFSGENNSFTVSEDTVIEKVVLKEFADNTQVDVIGEIQQISSSAHTSVINIAGNGSVNTIKADESAVGTEIQVSKTAVVNSITSNAQNTSISGEGIVKKATLNGNDSIISTSNTKVVVGNNATGVQIKTEELPTPTHTPTVSPTPSLTATSTPKPTSAPGTAPVVFPVYIPVSTDPVSSPTSSPAVIPTNEPTSSPEVPAVHYQTDERFATNYPQLVAENSSNGGINLTVKLQLDDGVASVQSPATVYYVLTTSDTSIDASSNSVIHGHLGVDSITSDGKTNHPLIYAKSGAVKVTSSELITIPVSYMYTNEETGLVAYFVIKTASQTSVLPTKVDLPDYSNPSPYIYDFDSLINNSVPSIDSVYWSDASVNASGNLQRTIRVFVSKSLNTASTVTGSAFTVTGVSGAGITAVSVHDNINDYASIDLVLTYSPAITNLDNLSILYNPPVTGGFIDNATTPHSISSFSLHRNMPVNLANHYLINEATPSISGIEVSSDGKYITLKMSPHYITSFRSPTPLKVIINGVDWEVTEINSFPGNYYIRVHNSAATLSASYEIAISNEDGTKIIDCMGKQYNILSGTITSPVISNGHPDSATFDLGKKLIRLCFSNRNYTDLADLTFACQFVLIIDGVEYHLRGQAPLFFAMDGKPLLIFDMNNMFDVDFTKITNTSNIKLALRILTNEGNSNLFESSGKPLENFEIPVSLGTINNYLFL